MIKEEVDNEILLVITKYVPDSNPVPLCGMQPWWK